MTDFDKRVDTIVDELGCSIAEAIELLQTDKEIDRGKKRFDFDLSPEEEKKAKKYCNVTEHKKPTVYKFDKKPRKENPTKQKIIKLLAETLKPHFETVVVPNNQKYIVFTDGVSYFTLDLKQATPKTLDKVKQQIREELEKK